MTLKRYHLSSRSYLVIILSFLFFLDGLALWIAAKTDYDGVYERARITLLKTASSLEERMKRTVVATDVILQGLAGRYAEKGMEKGTIPAEDWHRLRSAAQSLPDPGSIWLLDKNADLLLDSTQYPSQKINFAEREYFLPQKEQGTELYVGPVVKGKITKKYSFTISRRINGKDGRFLGIVLAAIDTDDFTNFLRQNDIGENGALSVFRTDGAMILRQPMQDEYLGKTFKHLKLFSMPLEKEHSGIFESSAIDGTRRLTAYSQMKNLPLIATAAVPIDSIMQNWRARVRIYTLTAILTFLLLVGFSWLVRKRTAFEEKEVAQQIAETNQLLQKEIIERTRAEEAQKTSIERLNIISDTASQLLMSKEPQRIVEAICRRIMDHLDCHAFFNYLVDEERGCLKLNAWAGIPGETAEKIALLDYGVAVCGCAARDSCRIVAEHIPTTLDPRTDLVRSFGIKAYACHPLFSQGQVIGTLSFGTRSRPTFSEDELMLMKTVADQVATAMERIRLLKAAEERADELGIRVEQRTSELKEAYNRLQQEVKERQKTEEQLRQVQKMEAIGTLAGGIAHDFNNILASILGFTELAIDDSADNPSAQKNLGKVLKSATRAKELVKQILAFSQKTSYSRSPLSLSPLIEETMHLLRASIPATVDIRFASTASSDMVRAAPIEIQQVLMNLATNASLAMQEKGGVMDVRLTDVDVEPLFSATSDDATPIRYLQLEVRDTGTGMTPEVAERIFEPFFTTRGVGKGSGMGLAVVYGIVKDLQGSITVESEPGKGSTFRVILPKIPVIDTQAQVPVDVPIPGGPEHILFVDDEEMIVEWSQIALERLGYSVTAVAEGSEALEIFSADPFRFDLVITDQTMPSMTGSKLAGALLAVRPDIPIILCTGHSETISPEKAGKLGIREFLMKPLDRRQLAEAVRKVLDQSR